MSRKNLSETRLLLLFSCALAIIFAVSCRGVSNGVTQTGPGSMTVTVTAPPPATGTIVSTPAGINCPGTCSANFDNGTQVVLTETPGAPSTFATFGGWSGACTGSATTCSITVNGTEAVTATFNPAINHIIVLAQENRSFDHYFGELRKYWADNGYPDQAFDGLPQFNPPFSSSPPPTNPPCSNPDPTSYCTADPSGTPVTSDHLPERVHREPQPLMERKPCRLGLQRSGRKPTCDARWLRTNRGQ